VVLYLVTSVGRTILAVLLYRSHLVPRWIAVLALVGYPVLFVGCVLDMFAQPHPSTWPPLLISNR
jgi:hypothetical protein